MNAKEAREITKDRPEGSQYWDSEHDISIEYGHAFGYLEALNGQEVKILIKALQYCTIEPERLKPENNRQNAVAMNALALFEQSIGTS